jgi:hypothetical protein
MAATGLVAANAKASATRKLKVEKGRLCEIGVQLRSSGLNFCQTGRKFFGRYD